MPSRDKSRRADYFRTAQNKRSLDEFRQVKPLEPSPGRVTASVQADRVRRPYTGRLCGNVSREHRAGGVR